MFDTMHTDSMGKTRTQIQLDPADHARIKAFAAERGISMAAAIRMLVRQSLGETKSADEKWKAFVRFKGGKDRERRTDVAERHDEFLYGHE